MQTNLLQHIAIRTMDMQLRDRIDKIVKWATANKLYRPCSPTLTFSQSNVSSKLNFISFILWARRSCEYDDGTAEYWVNTRTEGSLKREDMERLSKKRTHEHEVEADEGLSQPMDFSSGGFPGDLGAPGDLDLEGDARKTATHMHKNSMEVHVLNDVVSCSVSNLSTYRIVNIKFPRHLQSYPT